MDDVAAAVLKRLFIPRFRSLLNGRLGDGIRPLVTNLTVFLKSEQTLSLKQKKRQNKHQSNYKNFQLTKLEHFLYLPETAGTISFTLFYILHKNFCSKKKSL